MTREIRYEHFLIRAEGLTGRPADTYVAQVQGMVRALDRFKSSFVLTTACRFYRLWTLIKPYKGERGPCNALGGGTEGTIGATISFTPSTFQQAPCTPPGTAGNSPLEALVHELVHAVRGLSKTYRQNANSYEEEEFAMMVANIFSSEINRKLRGAYHGSPEVQEPVGIYLARYYRDYFGMIEKFDSQNQAIARGLARVDVPFNPLRLYYQRKGIVV